jgi:WhiB family redox-sensing transcriptional regulator
LGGDSAAGENLLLPGDPPLRARDVVCDNHTDVITPVYRQIIVVAIDRADGSRDRQGVLYMYEAFQSATDPGDHSWQEDANCLGVDPDLFFPERGASTREAKEVCRGCVVREECLEFALQNGEKFGIWGGLSERERRRIRRQRAQAARSVMGASGA